MSWMLLVLGHFLVIEITRLVLWQCFGVVIGALGHAILTEYLAFCVQTKSTQKPFSSATPLSLLLLLGRSVTRVPSFELKISLWTTKDTFGVCLAKTENKGWKMSWVIGTACVGKWKQHPVRQPLQAFRLINNWSSCEGSRVQREQLC